MRRIRTLLKQGQLLLPESRPLDCISCDDTSACFLVKSSWILLANQCHGQVFRHCQAVRQNQGGVMGTQVREHQIPLPHGELVRVDANGGWRVHNSVWYQTESTVTVLIQAFHPLMLVRLHVLHQHSSVQTFLQTVLFFHYLGKPSREPAVFAWCVASRRFVNGC